MIDYCVHRFHLIDDKRRIHCLDSPTHKALITRRIAARPDRPRTNSTRFKKCIGNVDLFAARLRE
jgi:hypothetical protein